MPNFRALVPADTASVIEIWRGLTAHYDHPIGGQWNENTLRTEIDQGHGVGAFNQHDELEAFCLISRAPGVREIRLLATRPRAHRTGAMRSLIRSIIEDLAIDEVLWLEVHSGNLPAVNLYESLGFQLKGERNRYYADGGTALLYEYKPLQ